jgi:ABC-type uncharacterized transport system ATPase subunit
MLLFADLHCSPKTLDVCLEVLEGIHLKAKTNNESVGFLGDFYDTVYRRGTIPVDMLNILLDFFATRWSVPMIMIPGNHDYIDASETEHALEPFGIANELITIVSEPCIIDRVMWVPWRRDNSVLKKMFAPQDMVSEYDVIFGHFDVVGAHVNNNTLSDRGLNKDDFPCSVISGHYHKPQTMGPVTYIGSPYQTSMGEAGQKKYFMRWDGSKARRIPINYGPRRFKVTENPESWEHIVTQSGDILYMDTYNPEKLSQEAIDFVERLKRQGVTVVLQRFLKETETANTLLDSEKELTPDEMFNLYAEHFKLKEEIGYDRAVQMVHQMQERNDLSSQTPMRIDFHEIVFEGFGPFRGEQRINLHGRGLTKITGMWENGISGSSNGAGKSMATVSAFLWCLTGYSDMRACTTLKKSQSSAACINHHTKQGKVELIGSFGGAPFKIYRRNSLLDKTTFLEVHYNNERVTRSTQAMTQELINNTFFRIPAGKSLPKQANKRLHAWLMRTIVWEQAGGSKNWLEMNDKGTKEELLLLCNMNIWQDLTDTLSTRQVFLESNIQSCNSLWQHAKTSLYDNQKALDRLYVRKEEWIVEHQAKLNRLTQDLNAKVNEAEALGPQPILTDMPINNNKRKHEQITKEFYGSQKIAEDLKRRVKRLYKASDNESLNENYTFDCQKPKYTGEALPEGVLDNAIAEATVRKQQLNLLVRAASAPTSCPTCKQALCVEHIDPQRIENAKTQVKEANDSVKRIKLKIKVHDNKTKEEKVKQERIELYNGWQRAEMSKIESKLAYEKAKKEMDEYEFKKSEWSAKRIELQHWEHERAQILEVLRLLRSQLENESEMACPMDEEEAHLKTQVADASSAVEKFKTDKDKYESELIEIKNIKSWVGHRGIQTYVVERMLHKISKHTTDWCEFLFDIQSQGSPVFKMDLDDNENISKELTFGNNKQAHALSGGQYRRLQIAAFMAWRIQASVYTGVHCNLCLLDEPASNIDVVGFSQMEQAMKDWCNRNKGLTCMFISHEIDANKGSSIYDTHIEVRAKTGNSYVHDFES